MFSIHISQDVRKPRLENGSVHLKETGSSTVYTELRSVFLFYVQNQTVILTSIIIITTIIIIIIIFFRGTS